VSAADQKLDAAADRLQGVADRAAAEGGLKAKLAQPLADDASFLRQLKPSLIAARARGDAPTGRPAGHGVVAPSGPQLGKRPKPGGGRGPSPLAVVGAAFVVGVLIAKVIDWRSHAHPRPPRGFTL
jgi:hypothetical protein